MTKKVLEKIITLQVKYAMNIQQAKQIFLKDFVSKALPDEYLGDDGTIPTNKFSAIRKSAVEKLMERLEKLLTEEIRTMEDYEDLLSCEELEELEEDTTKEDTMDIQQVKQIFLDNYLVLDYYGDNHLIEHFGVAAEKLEAFKEYFGRCDGATESQEVMIDIVENFYRDSEEDALSEEEDSDEEEEHICEICATAIDVDEDDWLNCDNCCTICCTDCYVYRPDIFGKKTEMDEENDCGWNNCEVCTDCDKEFRKADE